MYCEYQILRIYYLSVVVGGEGVEGRGGKGKRNDNLHVYPTIDMLYKPPLQTAKEGEQRLHHLHSSDS